jgi:DNA-binding GntR family transcriptional regulator
MPIPKNQVAERRQSAKERIFETVKKWIIEGQLMPGEKIVDVEIGEYFHVSRTPVREALQLLETQKLIKSYPGKTTLVADIETDHVEKWYEPMQCLQQLGMKLAVEKINEEGIWELKRIHVRFRRCVENQEDTMKIMELDKDFHDCILKAAANEYIIDFCETLWIHIQRLEYLFFKDREVLIESMKEHEKLIAVLEKRDAELAGTYMKNHWGRTVGWMRERIGTES